MMDNVNEMYNAFPDQRYFGMFDGMTPMLMVRDPELIKTVGIKEFDTFHDHRMVVDESDDGFGKTLFGLKGIKWRDMRATLSPAFSSSKMRNMFVLVEQSAKNMCDYFEEMLKTENILEIEAKSVFSKYTTDTFATSAFGIEVNSLRDENNDFYVLGKSISSFSKFQMIKLLLMSTFPKISMALKLNISNEKVVNFFKNLVQTSMKNREENNIVRPDMIHLLMEAKRGKLAHDKMVEDTSDTGFATVEESQLGKETVRRNWSDEYLAAQAFLFFFGGFDSTSNFLSLFFYEMVRQPDIQSKVQQEIDEIMKNTDDKFAYNNLVKLKYLDMCVSETLRMWPLAPAIDRQASKNYTFGPPSDDSNVTFEMEAGLNLMIPIYALHHDPQYYPDPEKFDPERFSDDNKSSINPATYLPFGIGPRNCIGSRYALMVVKAIILHILANFDIVATEKTQIPVQFENTPFSLKPKNGYWIGLKKRIK